MNDNEIKYLLSHSNIARETLVVDDIEYPAWRILHNNSRGPGKGGIRFHPNVSEDEVKSLSFWMSLKTALMGLPYGGAKGGVKVDPKQLTNEQLQELSREYIRKFHNVLGQDKDVPAPDVYTNPQIMSWMLDEYEKIIGLHQPAMITGKPIELGGCTIRGDATAKGGYLILKELIKRLKIKDPKIVIQGFGNAGMNITQMLYRDGHKIIAVSDSKGALDNPEGLDINKLVYIKKEKKSVCECKSGICSPRDEILYQDCDILILAALENQITKQNVNKIKAKYILELANGPITSDADKILYDNGVLVVPDILANAGGVVASYLEWVQNKTGNIFEKSFMDERLTKLMINNFHNVYEKSLSDKDLDMRKAAYIIAIEKILAARRLRS